MFFLNVVLFDPNKKKKFYAGSVLNKFYNPGKKMIQPKAKSRINKIVNPLLVTP